MIKSGIILTFFNVIVAALGLVRNILIARWLSVEDFGIASTFALTTAMVEMSANIGLDRLIVQAKDGNAERFQSTLQSFQLLRGLFGGAVLFLLAYPLSQMFNTPDALWAYQAMAVIPVLRGLVNLDLNRFQRDRIFWPSIATETAAQVVSTIIAIALAYEGGDYSSMLYALIGQQVMWTLLSQVLAERKFQFSWDNAIIRQAVAFGWPLLLNGALMFGTFYGDRVIVGNQLGPAVLGWFSVAYMLTLIPSTLLLRVVQTLALPVLAQHQDDKARFKTMALMVTEAGALLGVLLVVGNALCGGFLIHLLFGAKHELATTVLVPLAAVQALRLAKAGPSVVAIAKRQTTNPMWANLVRVAFLPIAYLAAFQGGGAIAVVWIAVLGEFAGLVLSYGLLVKKSDIDKAVIIRMFFACCLCISAPLIYDQIYPDQARAIAHIAGFLLVGVTLAYVLTLYNFRDWLRERFRELAARK